MIRMLALSALLLAGTGIATANDIETAIDQFLAPPGYERVDVIALEQSLQEYWLDTTTIGPGGAVGPIEKALLIATGAIPSERTRTARAYGELYDEQHGRLSFIELRHYNLGPAIRDMAIEAYGADNTADASEFGEGEHFGWRFVFMPLKAAQTFFRYPNSVSKLEILLDDADLALPFVPKLATALGPGFRIFDWQKKNSSFFTALKVERNVMFLILTLIILVAAFNIISSMIMLVKDKGRDIAILRTMGASKGMVMRIFFMSGASIGVIGTVAGSILGLVFCDNIESIRQFLQTLTGTELFSAEIYFLSKLPAEVDLFEVVSVIAMALFLTFAATIYPAWRASRLDPVEALRYE